MSILPVHTGARGERTDFNPLPLNALRPGRCLPFPLYVRSGRQHFYLYLPAGSPLTPSHYHHLEMVPDRVVYVSGDDRSRHLKYLQEILEAVVRDSTLPVDQKTAVIYGAVKEIVRQALEQPMTENIRACAEAARSQVELILAHPEALLHVLKIGTFDYYTYMHSVNVGFLLVGVLHYIDPILDQVSLTEYGLGGLLHDVGKTRIPKEIVDKPGRFTAAEFAAMREHPRLGVEVVRQSYELTRRTADTILQHHENLDGSGYPIGLTANELPLSSRLVRIIDIYDALTTKRSYRQALQPFQAFQLIKTEFAEKVDQTLVREVIRLVGQSAPH